MNDRFLQTVSFRTMIWFSGVFWLIAIFIFLAAYRAVHLSSLGYLDSLLLSESNEIANILSHESILNVEHFLNNLANSHGKSTMYIRLFDPDHNLLLASSDLDSWIEGGMLPEASMPAEPGTMNFKTRHFYGPVDYVRVLSRRFTNGLWIDIGHTPLVYIYEQANGFIFLFGLVLMLLVSASLVGYLSIRRAMSGVIQASRAAQAVGDGDFTKPLPERRLGAEIDELSSAIGEMRDKIQNLLRQQQEVITNVAHDLRSPLTRIRGLAENLLQDENRLNNTIIENAHAVVAESDRLGSMINTILEIAELKSGVSREQRKRINVANIIDEACDLYKPLMDSKDIEFLCDIPATPMYMNAEVHRIQRCTANLIENAIKFSKPGDTIHAQLEQEGGFIELRVSDTGMGIPEADMERLFDRFFRGDKSRSTEGAGLGLSLVKAIVDAYEGEVRVESQPNVKTTFFIRFPAA